MCFITSTTVLNSVEDEADDDSKSYFVFPEMMIQKILIDLLNSLFSPSNSPSDTKNELEYDF